MAHRLATAVAGWVAFRLTGSAGGAGAVADLAALAALLACAGTVARPAHARVYRLAAHAGLMGWLWRELAPLALGQGLATIAWGAWGLALLLVALQRGWRGVERVALLTLLATVAKLFLVDLARIEPLFRVILFLGFGTVFLGLSYALSGAWPARRAVSGR
jgi:uncharacterized membrane protein